MAAPMRSLLVGLAALWLPASLVMLVGPVWMAWGRWRAVLDGHPLTMVVALAVMVVGLIGAVWAIGTLAVSPTEPVRATFGRRVAATLSVIVLVLGLLVTAGLVWARPFPATDKAVAALDSDPDVRVVERLSWYELAPTDALVAKTSPTPAATRRPSPTPRGGRPVPKPRRVGMVFSPGARVDARAYAAILRPVAQTGVLVVVLKEPFGIALLPDAQAARVVQVHPEITAWVSAGHSLGAVRAAQTVQDQPAFTAMVLWGGYPASAVQRPGLRVLSVGGKQDGLSTPAKIDAAKSMLPPDTTYAQVAGANHAAFGDYGVQPGDGQVVGDRAKVQAQIVKLTVDFVDDLP